MKISTRDKKILLMFLGVLIFALSYFFVYKPQLAEAERIQEENVSLQERLDHLLEMAGNREFYENETADMQQKIQEYCTEFPSNVREEDGIVLAQNIEGSMDMTISNVSLGTREFVSSLDGNTQDGISVPDETMMEQANSSTQQQIDEIEGTDVAGEAQRQAAVEEAVEETKLSIEEYNPVLWRNQDTLQFSCTYQGLKDVIKYLADAAGRMTVDNVNASFDSATGNLSGSMTVNIFSMTGAGTTYTSPDAGSVSYGIKNIFGTIEKKKSKKSNKKKSTEQTTENTESAQETQAEQDTQQPEEQAAQPETNNNEE